MKLTNVIPLKSDHQTPCDVEIADSDGTITSTTPTTYVSTSSAHPAPSLLLPTLCHPHIHLDKPFLLNSHIPRDHAVGRHATREAKGSSKDSSKDTDALDNSNGGGLVDYSDLTLTTGSFSEALAKTSEAKTRYTHDDLLLRGSQLIAESIQCGVTSMRAFVEIDHVTQTKCLDAGIALKRQFSALCHVQLCAFAQDPVFNSAKHGDENRAAIERALATPAVSESTIEALGSTPYVEGSDALQRKNIEWAIDLAIKHNLHLDFHLDYNLDPESTPMIWYVVETLKQQRWTERAPGKTVMIGHCTRLTLFSTEEMHHLANEIHQHNLPISFVGLPTSDLFMMGRPPPPKTNTDADADKNANNDNADWGGARPRGTMQILELIRRFDLNACLGINNVGNAFTPWGSVDPLRLAGLGVGVYQAGTPGEAATLFECVSGRAEQAIGVQRVQNGMRLPLLLVENEPDTMEMEGGIKVPSRRRLAVEDVVWDPPAVTLRRVLRAKK